MAGWSRWFSKPFFVANFDFAFLTTKWHAFLSEMEPNLDLWSGKIDALLPIFYACVVFTAIRAFKNEKLHFLPLNWRFCSVISAWTLQNLYRQKALLTSFHMSQLLTQLDAYWLRNLCVPLRIKDDQFWCWKFAVKLRATSQVYHLILIKEYMHFDCFLLSRAHERSIFIQREIIVFKPKSKK